MKTRSLPLRTLLVVAVVLSTALQVLAAQWQTYSNPRFGFQGEVPTSFTADKPPANGDGASFKSADGAAMITLSGGNVTMSGELERDYHEPTDGVMGYHTLHHGKISWFVRSWKVGDQIYYQKHFGGKASMNGFLIIYPAAQAATYEPIVKHLEATFKPGNLQVAH